MRTIVLGIALLACGCGPSPTPPTNTVSPAVAVEVTTTNTEMQASTVKPVVRTRSPEQLRQRIRDTVTLMENQAASRARRQALQQVATAMVKYHQQRLQIPRDTTNLSWRVAVLPFLDEHLLYADFRDEEPWDSPHNEVLVARMPEVFGDDPLGLTRLQIMQGGKTPSSLMLIESGVDQQETWTQPRKEPFVATSVPEWIALRDGTVCRVDPKTSLATWQEWLRQSSGTLPSWIEKIPAQTTVRAVISDSVKETSTPRPFAFSANSLCVLSVQPRKILANPHVQAVYQHVMSDVSPHAMPSAIRTVLGPMSPRFLAGGVSWLQQRGMDLPQMESISVVVPQQVLAGTVQSTELFACVCRAAGSIDVEGVIAHEMESSPGFRFREQGATAGLIHPQSSYSLHFGDEMAFVVGGQSLVQELSVAQPQDSKLSEWIARETAVPLAIAFNAAPLQEMWQQRPWPFPPTIQSLVAATLTADGAVVTLNPDADEFLNVRFLFRDDVTAQHAHELWSKFLEEYRAKLPADPADIRVNVWGAWSQAMLSHVDCRRLQQEVRFTIARPDRFEELMHALTVPVAMKK